MADRACMAILRNGCILLVHQTYRGNTLWTFPGGGIEPGERPEETAVREVKEETGLIVKVKELLYQSARQVGEGTYYCYLGEIIGGEFALGSDPELPPLEQELHEVRWFPVQQVKDHSEVSRIWDKLAS